MNQNFKALVLTHKTAPVAVRELVALNEQEVRQFLKFMCEFTNASDVLILSTCNRTEIYYNAQHDYTTEIFKGLNIIKSISTELASYFNHFSDHAAVEHLFEVSIGLDAQIIGDLQISGQVKDAYQWSADEGMAGPFLHRLMHTIFFTNKRVVQETAFRNGAASISYAAKELAEELTSHIKEPQLLVIGVGEIGRDFCLNLKESQIKKVMILNRTLDKAHKLASESGFQFGSLDDLLQEIQKADIIVSSVSSEQPLISHALLKTIHITSHKFFIDLSLPRSIDPRAEEIPGIEIYNLDDIQQKTNKAIEERKKSILYVKEIIDQSMNEFEDWARETIVSPTIHKLKNTLEQIRKEEIARFLKNAKPEEAQKLEELSRSLMQKIMKYPVLQLKAACKRGDVESLTEVLHELFDLERATEKK